jgi:hypothetical protein
MLGVVCVGVVAFAALSATTHASHAAAACGKLLPPQHGVYFGVYAGWAFAPVTFDDIADPSMVRGFESYTGRKVVFAPWSISWHDHLKFPTSDVEAMWRAGYVPQIRLFNWPTQDYAPPPQPTPPGPVPNSDIAAGKHDAELRAFADAARDTDIPISFNYDGEMTSAHPWGGRFDGGGTTTGYGDPTWPDGPEHFRDAYRHIIDIFRQEGATNVTFFIQYNSVNGYAPGSYWEPWERFRNYYPGDDYIDWLGLSVYSEPDFNGSPRSFENKLVVGLMPGYEGAYAEVTALGSKPLAIVEMGLYKQPSEQAKAQWVEDASTVLQSGRYPRIAAINWWAQNKGGDYDGYPNTSQTFLDGFKQAFNQPFFDAKGQFSGDCRPLAPTQLTLARKRLTWKQIPNAAAYEVWRGTKRLKVTPATTLNVGANPGPYRVRGLNIVGFGPFARTR